jgi:succinoglycan biosynthesis transport protein ExoP
VLASVVDGAVLLIQHRRNPQSMVVRAQQIVESDQDPAARRGAQPSAHRSGDDYGYYTSNYSYYSEPGRKGTRDRAASGAAAKPERLELSEPDRRDER